MMAVPGQTDWRRTALPPEALCGAWPIILHPKTLSGATAGDSSAYRSKNSRLHLNNQRSQGVQGGPGVH